MIFRSDSCRPLAELVDGCDEHFAHILSKKIRKFPLAWRR
jgi:hypothetical protein